MIETKVLNNFFFKFHMFLQWYPLSDFIKELCMYQGHSFHFGRASLPESLEYCCLLTTLWFIIGVQNPNT